MTQVCSRLIRRLAAIQIKETNHPYYKTGLWPSKRSNSLFRFSIEDDNLFVSASIVYILQSILNQQIGSDQAKIKEMISLFLPRIDDYKNKDGKVSYNFWQTNPSQHFPHGLICRHLDYFRLPDDADDTSLIYLIDTKSKKSAEQYKNLLASHANTVKKKMNKGLKQFFDYPAYTTFFAERMPNEFDLCVQANILSVFYKYQLEFDPHTNSTIRLIKECIKADIITKSAFSLAPNYARPSIVFYHILRMIHFSKTNDFEDVYEHLKDQVLQLEAKDSFDQLLIAICYKFLNITYDLDYRITDFSPFFIAGMFSAFDNKLAQLIAPWQFTHIRYHSEAFNTALLLQYHSL